MKYLLSTPALILLGSSALIVPAMLSQPSDALTPSTTAVITNSGSTNTIGYRIYIAPSGTVNYITGIGAGQNKLPRSLARKFFRDIKAAMPLSQLPNRKACVRSVSFGTSTFIAFGGEKSPDISCPDSQRTKILESDVDAIVKTLRIGNVPRSEGKALPAQNF